MTLPVTPATLPGERGWRYVPPSPQLLPVVTPAAGAAATLTLPQGVLVRLQVVRAKLVTAVAVASRVPFLLVKAPTGTILYNLTVGESIPASKTANITWLLYGPETHTTATNPDQILPDILLPDRCTVTITVHAVQAADQLSTVTVLAQLY